MRWHTKPIAQLVVMFVVMSMVIGAQSTASALLTGNSQNKSVATVEDTGLIKVVAPTNNCNTSQVTFGQTESNPNNAEPRQPISTHRCEYDVFGPNCFNQTNNFALALQEHGNNGYVDRNASMQIASVAGAKDGRVRGMMESIFGFTPRSGFQDVKVFEYGSAWGDRGGQERTRGDAPAVKVPVPQGHSVCMPDTLYDIGGGEAMVVFAASDRVTLHIGRHEYIVGTTNNCGGQHCSGGYWIYINGINVDTDIVNAYESIRPAQEAAGANLTPISLPIVQAKRRLGTARAQNSITMTIWDDGRMLPLNDNHYWGTNFDDGGTPTSTPSANATATPTPNPNVPTNTPAAGTPTIVPTAPPAGPTPGVPGCFFMSADVQNWSEGGLAKFNVSVKFNSAGGDGDIQLERNGTHVAGWNGWNRNTTNPYVYGPEWTGGVINVGSGQNTLYTYRGFVANSVACPGVSADMVCTFNSDGTCSCGGTNCQAFAPPTPTAGPTLPVTPPLGSTATPTAVPGVPTPTGGATPTPDPNTPGISAIINQIVLTFFGTCTSNPLCNRLTILHGTAFNGRLGQFDSDPGSAASGYSDFGLGEYMGYSKSGNETRFTFHMKIPIHSYDEWKTTTLLLPDAPIGGSIDTFVIKP